MAEEDGNLKYSKVVTIVREYNHDGELQTETITTVQRATPAADKKQMPGGWL